MKVFISWSGNRSHAIAELLNDWIKCVLQATKPWMSSRDIERGSLWFTEIAEQLKDTAVGIVCITQSNKSEPWILFEAGALAKGLSSNRVCTFLIDLKSKDLKDPLAQFNHTLPDRDGLWNLVRTLNNSLSSDDLDERILEQVFETYWPRFEKDFSESLKKYPATEETAPRPESDILGEILENSRSVGSRVARLENLYERSLHENHRLRSSHSHHKNGALDRLRHMIRAEIPMEEVIDFCERNKVPSQILEREMDLRRRIQREPE